MGETDPNKTYEFLMRCVETAIRMEDKRRNMTEREMALKNNAQKPVVKPAAIVMEGTGARTLPLSGDKEKQASPAKELPKKGGGDKDGVVGKTGGPLSGGQLDGGQKGKGKGGGKDNTKGTTRPCHFYHFAKCTNEGVCPFSHAPITDEQKKELGRTKGKGREASAQRESQPAERGERGRTRERSSSPKGKSKMRQRHCFTFLKHGSCPVTDCPWQHLTKEEVAQMNKTAAAVVDAAVCVVCMQEENNDDYPGQLRSFYQDLVEMAESEIDFRCSGDLRFPASKVCLHEQNTGGLRLPVLTPDIVLAIAADLSSRSGGRVGVLCRHRRSE